MSLLKRGTVLKPDDGMYVKARISPNVDGKVRFTISGDASRLLEGLVEMILRICDGIENTVLSSQAYSHMVVLESALAKHTKRYPPAMLV